MEPAGGFYLEGGAEGTDSLTNNSFMCVLNTLLRMTINSDNMCSTLGDIQPSLSLWALTHHKDDLIAYISKQGVPEKEISTCIFRSLCLTYGANRDIPEFYRLAIEYLENKQVYDILSESNELPNQSSDDILKRYIAYLKEFVLRLQTQHVSPPEIQAVKSFTCMDYSLISKFVPKVIYINIPFDTSTNMWDGIKGLFTKTNKNDIFIHIQTSYIDVAMPLYQLMMISANDYICTDVSLWQDRNHSVYYSVLDGYLQNNSKLCYLPLYDLIFSPQHSKVKIRKNLKDEKPIDAFRAGFFDESNRVGVKFVPHLFHFQKIEGIDKHITDSLYAKTLTVDKVKDTITHLVKRLKLLLYIIDPSLHKNYYDEIKEAYDIYTSTETVEKRYARLLKCKYNFFKTYVMEDGTQFQASKLLQDEY